MLAWAMRFGCLLVGMQGMGTGLPGMQPLPPDRLRSGPSLFTNLPPPRLPDKLFDQAMLYKDLEQLDLKGAWEWWVSQVMRLQDGWRCCFLFLPTLGDIIMFTSGER